MMIWRKLGKRIDGYQQFQQSIIGQTKRLRENIFRDQLGEYLREFRVADSQISEAHINALEIRGVRTAKDISEGRLESLLSVDNENKRRLAQMARRIRKKVCAAF